MSLEQGGLLGQPFNGNKFGDERLKRGKGFVAGPRSNHRSSGELSSPGL